jgi:hypothetical protein
MDCQQCGRRAIVAIQEVETGAVFALCIDCNLKWEQSETLKFARLASVANQSAANLEQSLGIPVARFHIPRVPLTGRPVTMNNINIAGDLLGVLNTGSVETVNNSVTALRNSGDDVLAELLARFVESVAQARDLPAAKKKEVVELVSMAASEATAPKAERRSAAMLRVLADIATVVGTAATLATQWGQLQPLLARAFG